MLLSIKLGSCLTMPDKGFAKCLRNTLRDCNRAKNAAIRSWFLTHDQGVVPEKLEWGKEHYHAARSVCRGLASNIASSCEQDAKETAKAKMPFNMHGKNRAKPKRYRWQAIISGDISLPSFKGSVIPLPNRNYVIGWDGATCGKGSKLEKSKSTCVLQMTLFSGESGFSQRPVVRLLVGDLKAGHKAILERILDPNDSLVCCDASLCEKDGKWFLRLPYKDTKEVESKLTIEDGDRVVLLMPNDYRRSDPLVIIDPEGNRRFLGNGRGYEHQYKRVEHRRIALRSLYKHGRSGNGHGRSRYFEKQRPVTRFWQNWVDRAEKNAIADIVKMVKTSSSTGVVYREPTMPLRNSEWFGKRGLPWAWSEFELKLKAKLRTEGIAFKLERIGHPEYKKHWGIKDVKKKKAN